MKKLFPTLLLLFAVLGCAALEPAREPLLWPRPQSCIYSGETFKFQADAGTTVQVSAAAAGTTALDHFSGLFLNRLTAAAVNTDGFVIALGDCTVPGTADIPAEGYILDISKNGIVIAASDAVGLLNGVRTLRQLVTLQEEVFSVPCGLINDAPAIPVRGMHMMLCDAYYNDDSFEGAKNYISALGQLKYNVLVLQLDALPDYKSVNLTSHITKWPMEKLKELGEHAKAEGIEVVPLLQLGGHSGWFLRTPEHLKFWEKSGERNAGSINWDNSMLCPGQDDELLPIIFGMIDELVEVFDPMRFHIAYDEIYLSDRLCPACLPKTNHVQELYSNQINAIAAYLKTKDIKAVIWGDRPLSIPMRKVLGMDSDLATHPMVQWLSPDNLEIMNWYYGKKREAFPTVVEYFREHGFYDQSLAVMCFDHNAENGLASALAADVPALYNTLWYYSNGSRAMQFNAESWNNLPYFADLAWRGNEPDKDVFRNRLNTVSRGYYNDFPIKMVADDMQTVLYGDTAAAALATADGVKVYPGAKTGAENTLSWEVNGYAEKVLAVFDVQEINFGKVTFTERHFTYPSISAINWKYADGTEAASPVYYEWHAGPAGEREFFEAETVDTPEGKVRISVLKNPSPEKKLLSISVSPLRQGSTLSAVTLVAAAPRAAETEQSLAEKYNSTEMNKVLIKGEINNGDGIKIAFFGNSITLHHEAPHLGWHNSWGMAASAEDKDYVHIVIREIEKRTGLKANAKIHPSVHFELNPANFDFSSTQDLIDFAPEILIFAIGENVPELKTQEEKFAFRDSFKKLIESFMQREDPPLVIVRGSFWQSEWRDQMMKEAAEACGAKFVKADLAVDPSMMAMGLFEHYGVQTHPGDKGMEAIARRILSALFEDQ